MSEPIVLPAGSGHVHGVAWSPDGALLAAACGDARARLWRTSDWVEERVLEGHTKSVNSLAFSADGRRLVTCSTDASLRLWSLPEGTPLGVRNVGRDSLVCARFTPDGAAVLSGGYDGALRLWGVPELDERAEFRGPAGSVLMVGEVSPSGKFVVGAGRSPELHLWRLPAGEPVGILPGHGAACASVAFAPRGALLASAGTDGTLRLIQAAGWKRKAEVDLDADGTFPLAWRSDGEALAVGSERRVRIYSAPDLKLERELELPPKGVYGLAFAPDSGPSRARLACAAADKRVRVWDLA